MKFVIKKRARFMSSMIAGAGFSGLAVWGWGLPLATVMLFFALCLAFLVLIILSAAVFGWALGRLRNNKMD